MLNRFHPSRVATVTLCWARHGRLPPGSTAAGSLQSPEHGNRLGIERDDEGVSLFGLGEHIPVFG